VSRAALQLTRSQVNRWFLIQIVAIILATVAFLILKGPLFAKAVFLGGLLCIFPQWLFACLWFFYYKASAAPKIVKMFYIGEVVKLLLTGILFVMTLKYLAVNPLGCFSGFIIAQIAFWVAPLFSTKKTTAQK
jgi:ATP synthase protein I